MARRIAIGPAGWSYEDWKGKVYPQGPPRGFDPLTYLSGYFDCIELNNTFYRPPSARMSEAWVRKTPEGFVFTAKLWEKFTHEGEPFGAEDVRVFREGIAPLVESGKLGALLVQFPWSFRDVSENRDRVRRIAEAFRGPVPLSVEVRHRSWLEAVGFFRELELSFCNIDQPASATAITGTNLVTGPVGYVRLHGRNAKAWFTREAGRDEKYDYLYSVDELKDWARGIRAMDAGTVFVILNNHFQGKAVANALQLKRLLDQEGAVPPAIEEAYPSLFPGGLHSSTPGG